MARSITKIIRLYKMLILRYKILNRHFYNSVIIFVFHCISALFSSFHLENLNFLISLRITPTSDYCQSINSFINEFYSVQHNNSIV